MFSVIFICGNFLLGIAGKIAKIRTRKNFVRHGIFFSERFLPYSVYNLLTMCGIQFLFFFLNITEFLRLVCYAMEENGK